MSNDGSSFGVFAQRFAVPQLLGGNLRLINKVPDNPVKNKAAAVARSSALVAGAEGRGGDPTIAGGTIRFRSFVSGHDTGILPLPASNWTPIGAPGSVRGWRYKDTEQDDGPCKLVLVRRGGLAKAICSGRNAAFPYDLVPGINEGDIGAVLTTGNAVYCLGFTPEVTPSGPKNGSDGKLYLAKSTPAPAACVITALP